MLHAALNTVEEHHNNQSLTVHVLEQLLVALSKAMAA
jgi:hypothetical protein